MPGAALTRKNSLPRLRDRNWDTKFINAGLQENEQKGFGYRTGFRELPYTEQNRYTRALTPQKLNTVILENDLLRATFLADFGGRLWSLYDKKNEKELLYSNPVHRIGNLAIRNAWFSGGIEWNLGQYGHTCLTCEPMFFARCATHDGQPFLRMYEYERQKGFFLQIDFHLEDGDDKLYAHVKIVNSHEEPVPLYYWTNIAVKERDGVRVFSGSREVICIRPEESSFVNGFAHDRMPYLKSLNGKDASYPKNLFYSNEYFFQNQSSPTETWEAAVYPDGSTFWERSTPSLRYRKMFCWGVQRGGKHWKDFLSREGEGDYFEIQAGLSPTQVHGEDLGPKGCVRFTQVFGGMSLDYKRAAQDWEESRDYTFSQIEGQVTTEELLKRDCLYKTQEELVPEEILHLGSGWGALEAKRNPDTISKGLVFPQYTLGEEQEPWLKLLHTGRFPKFSKSHLPISWMLDVRWMKLLASSLEKEENQSAAGWLHLGMMLYENGNRQDGINAMKRSVSILPTAIGFHNLAQAALQNGQSDLACAYTAECLELDGASQSEDFVRSAIELYTQTKHYREAWACYCALPDEKKNDESVRFSLLRAAFEMQQWNFLELQFQCEFAIIREGNNTLLDLWYEYQAIQLAKSRNTPVTEAVLSEVKSKLEPPSNLDFRMR